MLYLVTLFTVDLYEGGIQCLLSTKRQRRRKRTEASSWVGFDGMCLNFFIGDG